MKCLNALSLVPVVLAALSSPLWRRRSRGRTRRHTRTRWASAVPHSIRNFSNPTASVQFEYGERVSRNVTAYANFSFIDNLMSDPMRPESGLASSMLGQQFSGRDRGLAFTMGGQVPPSHARQT
jgi:hypothetical protein